MTTSREAKLASYEKLIAGFPDLERKGKTTDYTSLNGNMLSFLSPEGLLAFRLSSEERTEFLERFPDSVVEQYGRVMKDYVEVPNAILDDEPELQQLFERCVANARGLRPKATTRRPKQGGKQA